MCGLLGLGVLSFADQAAAQSWTLGARAGVALSTPLADDRISAARDIEPVVLRVAPAPTFWVTADRTLRPGVKLESSAGWARASQRLTGGGARRVGGLDVVHATVGLRVREGRYHARGGAGVIHYIAARSGVFRDGTSPRPLLEAGIGAAWPVGAGSIVVEMTGQAHRFGTPALRAEGGVDGTVYRIAVTGGYSFNGSGP